jgi:hypothetical protein
MNRAIFFCLTVLLAGCASLPPLDPFQLPGGQEVRGQVTKADPARLGVAVAFEAEEWAESRKDFGDAARVRVDGPALRRDFVGTLASLGLFSAVEEVGDGNVLADPAPYVQEAKARNLDLLMVLRPTKARVAFQGHNSLFAPSVALWVLLWFPSWWVADEEYVSEVGVRATLLRVADGKEIHAGEWTESFQAALDDFQRAWVVLGLLRVPGALEPADYEEIGKTLSPHAYNLAKIALMKDLVAFVGSELPRVRAAPVVAPKPLPGGGPGPGPKPATEPGTGPGKTPEVKPPDEGPKPRPEVAPAKPRRLALAVGAGSFQDAAVPAVPFAAEDASAFADFLKASAGFAAADVNVLAGEGATLARVREALKELAKGPGLPDDLLVVYFSGRGMVQKGAAQPRLFLALRDTNPANLTLSALFVPEIRDLLSKAPGRVRVVLDASFAGAPASRSFGEAVSGGQDVLRQAFGGSDRWACLYAAGDGSGALALDEVSHGLFTHFLLKGLSGEADTDAQEGICTEELAQYLAKNVPATADFLGESQVPGAEARDRAAKFLP